MNLKSIDFNAKIMPESVTVEMTINEALFIAKLLGGHSPRSAEEVLPKVGADALESIWDCLAGRVFNVFWNDGVREALRDVRHANDGGAS